MTKMDNKSKGKSLQIVQLCSVCNFETANVMEMIDHQVIHEAKRRFNLV